MKNAVPSVWRPERFHDIIMALPQPGHAAVRVTGVPLNHEQGAKTCSSTGCSS
jgi:hypothetical protein